MRRRSGFDYATFDDDELVAAVVMMRHRLDHCSKSRRRSTAARLGTLVQFARARFAPDAPYEPVRIPYYRDLLIRAATNLGEQP
jgi:hypothetical protein